MAEYTFCAYTKHRNNCEFNKTKELASDKTNLAFCTVVQTGGKDVTEYLCLKETKLMNNAQLSTELGFKIKTTRKRKAKEEIIGGYEKPYKEALDKLLYFANYPVLAKLSKI